MGEPRQQSLRSLSYPTTNAYGYVLISVLTTYRIYATPNSFSLMRGVSGDDPPDGAGRGVPWPTASETEGAGGTGPVGSCDRAGGQVATWIRWTLPELKRGPAAGNRHGGAPRGAIPVAPGSPRAVNAASRLASVIEDPVCALRRSDRHREK